MIEFRRENGKNARPETVPISNFIYKLREFEAVINDAECIMKWRHKDVKMLAHGETRQKYGSKIDIKSVIKQINMLQADLHKAHKVCALSLRIQRLLRKLGETHGHSEASWCSSDRGRRSIL